MEAVAIADVAEEIVEIEICEVVRAQWVLPCDEIGGDATNPFLAWASAGQVLHRYRLRDVILDASYMVLLHGDRLVQDTRYVLTGDRLERVLNDRRDPLPLPAGRTVVMCADHLPTNYYHWICHTVPALQAARQIEPAPRLALPATSPIQAETLALLGYSLDLRDALDREQRYFVPELDYCEFVHGQADFSVSACAQDAYDHMSAGVPTAADGHPRIYVARTDAWQRRMRNEVALIERLRGEGFEIVVPGELSFAEQIRAFRAARLVVGGHGAGMTNIVFCKPGAVIYELVPAHYINPCFLKLGTQNGLRYWADGFSSEGDGPDYQREWELDIDLVMRRIEQIKPHLVREDRL